MTELFIKAQILPLNSAGDDGESKINRKLQNNKQEINVEMLEGSKKKIKVKMKEGSRILHNLREKNPSERKHILH